MLILKFLQRNRFRTIVDSQCYLLPFQCKPDHQLDYVFFVTTPLTKVRGIPESRVSIETMSLNTDRY